MKTQLKKPHSCVISTQRAPGLSHKRSCPIETAREPELCVRTYCPDVEGNSVPHVCGVVKKGLLPRIVFKSRDREKFLGAWSCDSVQCSQPGGGHSELGTDCFFFLKININGVIISVVWENESICKYVSDHQQKKIVNAVCIWRSGRVQHWLNMAPSAFSCVCVNKQNYYQCVTMDI